MDTMGDRITAEDVKKTLDSSRESDEPDAILAVLKAEAGKQLTKRLLAKLPGGDARWLIRQVAGMTYLEDRDYLHSSGNHGLSFLVAYALKSITIDPAFVEARNPSYFGARVERNAKRARATDSQALCERMASAINAVRRARAELEAAEAEMEKLTRYGAEFSADSLTWEKLGGK
jgi:hypothetical protein